MGLTAKVQTQFHFFPVSTIPPNSFSCSAGIKPLFLVPSPTKQALCICKRAFLFVKCRYIFNTLFICSFSNLFTCFALKVIYSKDLSVILHTLPIGILLLVPFYLTFPNTALVSFLWTLVDLLKGIILQKLINKHNR